MAFSSVAATNSGNTGGSLETTHTCNLPASIQSGDLLVLALSLRLDGTDTTITWPSGWTERYQANVGAQLRAGCIYRVADGTEGATVNVTTSGARRSSHVSYRIAAWHGTTTPESATFVREVNDNASSSPDPPSLSPSWGAEDTLWLVVLHAQEADAVSAYPTNYTNGFYSSGGAFHPLTGSARRELNATSDDPVVATLSKGARWIAGTTAIRPAAAGGGGVADLTVTLSAFGAAGNATLTVFGAANGVVTLEAGYTEGAAQSAESNILHTAFRADNDTTPTGTINPAGNKLLGIAVELKASSPTGTKPVAPSAPTITAVNYQTLTLSCTDNASNEDGFKWYLGKNGASFAEVTGSPTGANATTLQYVDPTPGVGGNTYRLRVVAYNAFGDSDAAESNQIVTTTITSDPVETTTAFPTGTFPTGTSSFPTISFPASSKFPS